MDAWVIVVICVAAGTALILSAAFFFKDRIAKARRMERDTAKVEPNQKFGEAAPAEGETP